MKYAKIDYPLYYDLTGGVDPTHLHVVSFCLKSISKRFEILSWLNTHMAEFSVVQALPFIKFFFRTEEDAVYFMFAWKGEI
jgi:hypothetical protein